jgi:hypothetical protein
MKDPGSAGLRSGRNSSLLDEKPPAAKIANADTDAQNECTQYVSSIASGDHSVVHICCSLELLMFDNF